jgi:hypothetical protein
MVQILHNAKEVLYRIPVNSKEILFIRFCLIEFAAAELAADPTFVICPIQNIMLQFAVIAILAFLIIIIDC